MIAADMRVYYDDKPADRELKAMMVAFDDHLPRFHLQGLSGGSFSLDGKNLGVVNLNKFARPDITSTRGVVKSMADSIYNADAFETMKKMADEIMLLRIENESLRKELDRCECVPGL